MRKLGLFNFAEKYTREFSDLEEIDTLSVRERSVKSTLFIQEHLRSENPPSPPQRLRNSTYRIRLKSGKNFSGSGKIFSGSGTQVSVS